MGYHNVSIYDEEKRFPQLFLDRKSFEKRLSFMKKNFHIITLSEAIQQINSNSLRANQIVLTFDDGLYNFKSSAYEILEKYQASATVYVITKYVENQSPNITMLIRDIVLRCKLKSINAPFYGLSIPYVLCNNDDHSRLSSWALEIVNNRCDSEDKKYIFARGLAKLLDVNYDDIIQKRIWHTLNRDELFELDRQGVDIQVHGHSHLDVLADPEIVEKDISTGKAKVKEFTSSRGQHFCYPSGIWSRKIWPVLEKLNIQSATTTHIGPNFSKTPLYALRRIMDGGDKTQLEFEYQISLVKWIASLPFNRSLLYAPTEKLKPYKETGKGM